MAQAGAEPRRSAGGEPKAPPQRTDPIWWGRPAIGLIFVVVCAASLALVTLNPVALAGDPAIYRSRMVSLFAGEIPYVSFPFEHLPIAAIPMIVAWVLGGALSPEIYTLIFAILMAAALLHTAFLTDELGRTMASRAAGIRWLVIAGPLFPLVLFRSDPWAVLLATAALSAMVRGREMWGVVLGVSAGFTKAWPVVLAGVEWHRGRRRNALVLMGTLAALIGLLVATPGFRSVRFFSGIHTDTVLGAAIAALRAVNGQPVGRIDAAGAIYLEAPSWVVVLNANLGIALIALALARVEAFSWQGAVRLAGALTVGLLIGIPLLSPQFIIWFTPLVALHSSRLVRHLGFWVVTLTMVFMLGWNPVFEGNLWWLLVMNLRNIALVALGVVMAWVVGDRVMEESSGPGGRPRGPVALVDPAAT